MPSTHTADFQTGALKATDLEAVEKVNVGLETELVKKHVNIIADAPEIRIQDKTGSAPEVNATTMSIVADGGTTHFRAGTETFAEGTETKGNVKFQSSTGATTHAEIVGSSGKLELQDGGLGLKLGSNVSVSGTSKVIQEITGPHARESAVLKKYPEVVFAEGKFEYNDTTYTQAGYTVTASNASVTRPVWQMLDGSNDTLWGTNGGAYNSGNPGTVASSGSYPGEIITLADSTQHDRGHWMKIKFPHKVRLSRYYISAGSPDRRPASISILGSNDDSNWYIVKGVHSVGSEDQYTIEINASTAYRYALLLVHSIVGSDNQMVMDTFEYYGYEEVGAGDDSVDTTVKSVYNAPDLTSAALYIDGLKGSAATDHSGSSVAVTENNVTYDSSEKAWELTGAVTSNIVSANLTSLVGDHPHSISAWVKADQLNGDGLFHVGTAEGEGDAASRVGFVDDSHISWGGDSHFFSNAEWHNVTYTHNGEGSDKKLYLDGRLVGTAKNEDTFGDYPPFAMTTYSENGYSVSASSNHSTYPPYQAFNNTLPFSSSSVWITANSKYNASDGTPTGSADTTVVDGTNQVGEWLQLELPHQLKVSYMDIAPQGQNTGTLGRAPKDGIIAGSRDGSTWETMKSWTGVTDWALSGTSGVFKTFVIDTNTDKAYKYIRIIITNTVGGTDAYGALNEVKIYGHRENDLVRFPDSVNVLTYPHINFTGHENIGTTGYHATARRGYVVSASTKYAAVSASDAWRAFDGVVDLTSGSGGQSWDSRANSYATPHDGALTGRASTGITTFNSRNGEWINVKFPRKVLLTSYQHWTRMDRDHEGPYSGYLYGSNDGFSTFQEIHRFAAITLPTTSGGVKYLHTVSSSYTPSGGSAVTLIPYNEYRLQVTHTQASTYLNIALLEFYGTEPEDVIARVGDGFDGKVRNVRVYSTALSDARVQEIFDADKDEFGLAKSSVSVYRGHLGVGTTEPKAALTVMDEVAELEEFPPRAMTGYKNYFEGHGEFCVSASHQYTTTGNGSTWKAFDKNKISEWQTVRDFFSGGVLTGTGLTTITNGIGAGIWLQIECPYKVSLKKFVYSQRGITSRTIKNGYVVGSNDTITWDIVHKLENIPIGEGYKDYHVPVSNYNFYKYFRLITTEVHGGDRTEFTEWKLFGTREQGASTLHNGELSLTRNLTVPRIGPPLDADDTPRRDRLVVEYNTSTNPMENGVVKDTSGRGHDGRLDNTYGGAAYNPYYDATEKALVFDGSNDYVFQNDVHLKTGVGGVYSASVWVRNRASSGTHAVYSLGTYAQLTTSTLYVLDTTLQVVFYNSDLDVTYTIPKNTWTNIVVTHGGGQTSTTTKMYINGVDVGLAASSGTSFPLSTVNFPSPCNLFLGKNSDNSVYGGPMDLSNFKLWDTELSAEDAKRLYDMGRCDEGHHVVNFSKTRVGIGLGDGEAPQAALDVMGIPYGRGAKPCFSASRRAGNVTSGNTIIFDHVEVNQQNGYNSTNGVFTAPVSGLYLISFYGMSSDTGNSFGIRAYKNGDTYEMFWPYTHHSGGSPHKHVSGTQIVPMNTGDTILFKVQSGTLYGASNGHNSFTGYLIE